MNLLRYPVRNIQFFVLLRTILLVPVCSDGWFVSDQVGVPIKCVYINCQGFIYFYCCREAVNYTKEPHTNTFVLKPCVRAIRENQCFHILRFLFKYVVYSGIHLVYIYTFFLKIEAFGVESDVACSYELTVRINVRQILDKNTNMFLHLNTRKKPVF